MPYVDKKAPIFTEAATELSQRLGEGWHPVIDPDDGHARRLAGPGGAVLYLSDPDHYDKMQRVHIAGGYPQSRRPRADSAVVDSINVRLSRGFDTVAKEVERRLLPGYLAALEVAQRAEAEAVAERTTRREIRDDLVFTYPGARVIESGESDYYSHVAVTPPGAAYSGDVKLWSDGRQVHIEFRHISIETARRMLDAAFADEGAQLRVA